MALSLRWGGLLLLGPPGSGKSDLALRLVDRGARLVADDHVPLSAEAGGLVARAPPRLAGRLELRGLGLVEVPQAASALLVVAIDCAAEPPRLPQPAWWTSGLGPRLPLLAVAPFHASAPLLAERAVAMAASGTLWAHDDAR